MTAEDATGATQVLNERNTTTTTTTTISTKITTTGEVSTTKTTGEAAAGSPSSATAFTSYFTNIFGGKTEAVGAAPVESEASAGVVEEEPSDGIHAKKGTAVRALQDKYDEAEAAMSAAQTAFERAATEYQTARDRAEVAKKSGVPGAATVADAAVAQAKSKYAAASSNFQMTNKALEYAAKKKRQGEVELAESIKAREARDTLFGSKGKIGGHSDADDLEAKRLMAVIKLQRAWRRYKTLKKQRKPEFIARTVVQRIFSRETAFALLLSFLLLSGSVLSSETRSSGRTAELIRTFSALDHGYLGEGISSGIVTAQLTVMRSRHNKLLSDVEECEATLHALRKGEGSLDGSIRSPLAGTCSYKLREAEKELAQMKKSEVDCGLDKQLKLLQSELALARHEVDVQKIKNEEEIASLNAVHEAESEKLMALAQANIMDAKHEGARLLRKAQIEHEEILDQLESMRDQLSVYENQMRGDPLGIDELVKKHNAVLKSVKDKNAAALKALDDEYRAKLSLSKAENVRNKNEDLKSLSILKEKSSAAQRSLEDKVRLANEQATAAKNQVCKSKSSSTLSYLVYPLIAAVGLLLGVVAQAGHQPTHHGAAKSAKPKEAEAVRTEPAMGVPVCRRCEAAEEKSSDYKQQAKTAEDAAAKLRNEIRTLQEDNARVHKRLEQRVSMQKSPKKAMATEDGDKSDSDLTDTARLEEENIKLSSRVHEAQARALELTEQREMLTLRIDSIQKKLIEEGVTIKELSESLVRVEKENFELKQVVDECRAETRVAERKLEDVTRSLDSTGKERGGMQVELDAVNKRLRDATAQLTKAAMSEKQKDAKIEAILLAKDDIEKKLAAATEDVDILQERYTNSERLKVQLEAQNVDLQAQLRRSKSTSDMAAAQLQKRLMEVETERNSLSSEQGRLLDEIVSKQEEIDQLMQHVMKLQESDDSLGSELADLVKINETMRARMEQQEELIAKSHEKDLKIIEHEVHLQEWGSRFEQAKAKLRSCELAREEGLTMLRNRDERIGFLEEELKTIRDLHGASSSRLKDQLQRLGELEMDAARKLAAKEAAEAKLEQSEAAARMTIAQLETEISKLQNQLVAEQTAAEALRTNDGITASKLRQESRELQEKIAALNSAEVEKENMAQEIVRLERELEELRRRLAELMSELANVKIQEPGVVIEQTEQTEERQALVYDEATDLLRGLRRISLYNLLYSVTFSKVRDLRQWRALTLTPLCEAVRPITTPPKRDDLFYAKKRGARGLIALANAPHHHKLSRGGWSEVNQAAMTQMLGWHNAEDVWIWATRSLAAISRIFQGGNAYQMYQLGGLQTALELMRQAESDAEIQLHGARAISGMVSGNLAFYGQEAPQIVSGSALETLAITLQTFPLDARVVRAAARATWVCVHLGRQFGQHTFVQHKVYEPLMFAMNCHLGDLKVVESCCGAVLAAAARNPNTQAALTEAGVRDLVRDVLQTVSELNFSGTFSELSEWLFEE